MSTERLSPTDPRMERAITEMQERIAARYPMATFEVEAGEEPEVVYLTAVMDLDDPDEVLDVVIDRLLELEIDEGLPLYVVPARTPERIAAMLSERKDSFQQLPSRRSLPL